MRRIYLITRDLHLYVGLFLSPFILVFSISVFYLVHGLALRPAPDPAEASRTATNLSVPPDIARPWPVSFVLQLARPSLRADRSPFN
jgi:hypothetical protein